MYRTGDKGYVTHVGKLAICGRMNNREVKVRGFRIDLVEVEKSILDHSAETMMASVQVEGDSLTSFVVPMSVDYDIIRIRLAKDLPPYSIPTKITAVDDLPRNNNRKVDHAKVLEFVKNAGVSSEPNAKEQYQQTARMTVAGDSPKQQKGDAILRAHVQQHVAEAWIEVLGLKKAPAADVAFFEAGGHSILLTTLHKRLAARLPSSGLRLFDLFQNSTIEQQVNHVCFSMPSQDTSSSVLAVSPLVAMQHEGRSKSENESLTQPLERDVFAIVGMAGRFPGADTVKEYFNLLLEQLDGVTTLDSPTIGDKMEEGEIFVPRFGLINEKYNAQRWNLTAAEKGVFLDVAAEALDDANMEPTRGSSQHIGAFVGATANTHMHDPDTPAPTDPFEARYRTILDPTISTFVSYKLNLTGPNLTVNTACASSLVALHKAINALKAGDCESVLVGGTSILYPQSGGYETSAGKIFAASGQCRPLDARSDGSVPSDCVAAVVIKPLDAAQYDGDTIYSVIEAHAIGTDGNVDKVGFVVPSSTGQSRTVSKAIHAPRLNASNIKYVELHGSGTSVGDALEVQGLEKAFDAADVPADARIYVGSNKGNCGNSETASGLMSLIKASMAIHEGVVPPLRELGETNPMCDFESTRFRPLTEKMTLGVNDKVGVTSLGYGGTNAHLVLGSSKAYSAPNGKMPV